MYKKILHATDLSGKHFHVSEKAREIADKFGAELFLLHVIELPTSVQLAQSLGFAELGRPSKDDAIIVMKTLGEAINVPEDHQIVEIGAVSHHIFDQVKKLGCEAIIIGAHNHHDLGDFLGSTASATVNHAPCDVITLKD